MIQKQGNTEAVPVGRKRNGELLFFLITSYHNGLIFVKFYILNFVINSEGSELREKLTLPSEVSL